MQCLYIKHDPCEGTSLHTQQHDYVLYPIVAQNMGEKLSGFENLNLSLLVSVCGLAVCVAVLFFFDNEIPNHLWRQLQI